MTMRASLAAVTLAAAGVAPAVAQTVVLVRHAEKAAAPAEDPPLTAAGESRAAALAEALKDARIRAVIATPLRRTAATAAPAARAAGLAVVTVPVAGGTAAHADAVAAAVREAGGDGTVLVVGHSNTIPAIARALGLADPPEVPECAFDRMILLDISAPPPVAVHARYGAPSAGCDGG